METVVEVASWLQKPFARQLKGAPVNSNGLFGLEDRVDLDGLCWVILLIAKELSWEICANRQQTQVDRAVLLSDFLEEAFFVAGVSGIVYFTILGSDD